ncbi:nucleotide-diphospho-sugar transferase, partial [Caulochytrium protostelioides]
MSASKYAYVTLLTSDAYLPGALVWAESLRAAKTPHDLAILVTPETVTHAALEQINRVFDRVVSVPTIRSQDVGNLQLLGRRELDITFTKLHVWNPDTLPYERVIFMDADTLVLKPIDELFDAVAGDVAFAAAPDVGWPDCFNSGVFVTKPEADLFASLVEYAHTNGSFDGGDQGLLNAYFNSWASGSPRPGQTSPTAARLPFQYNVTPSPVYSYLPAYVYYKADIKVVHFIGPNKPWTFE